MIRAVVYRCACVTQRQITPAERKVVKIKGLWKNGSLFQQPQYLGSLLLWSAIITAPQTDLRRLWWLVRVADSREIPYFSGTGFFVQPLWVSSLTNL